MIQATPIPVLLSFGDARVYSRGVCFGLAFLLGLWMARRRAANGGITPATSTLVYFAVCVGIALGSKAAFYVFEGPVSLRTIGDWGTSSFGAIAGGILFGLVSIFAAGAKFWRLADQYVDVIAVWIIFGRLSCFLVGCCAGTATDAAYAISYAGANPVHPAQLYEAGLVILILLLPTSLGPDRMADGEAFLLFMGVYGGIRAALDFIRESPIAYEMVPYALIVFAVGFWFYNRGRKRAHFSLNA